jgi:plasmid stabilization system protein ParE
MPFGTRGKVWGERKKAEYKELIREAKDDLRENPLVAALRPDIHPEARVHRIAKPGRDAAHAFVCVVAPGGDVILVRFLNETMDLPRHFPSDYSRNLSRA